MDEAEPNFVSYKMGFTWVSITFPLELHMHAVMAAPEAPGFQPAQASGVLEVGPGRAWAWAGGASFIPALSETLVPRPPLSLEVLLPPHFPWLPFLPAFWGISHKPPPTPTPYGARSLRIL